MLRLVRWFCLATPVFVVSILPSIVRQRSTSPHPPSWLGAAQLTLATYTLLSWLFPLALERHLRGPAGQRMRARGQSPAEVLLTTSVAIAVAPCLYALILVMLFDAPARQAYLYAVACFAIAILWERRFGNPKRRGRLEGAA